MHGAKIAVAIIAALLLASTAAAGTQQQKLRKSATVVAWYENQGAWHLRPSFEKCAQIRWDRPAARCYKHRQGYRWHKQRYERLKPKPTISHLAGWLCIHAREGAWNANTGNGYYGGLQMTYGWMGQIPGRASDLTPMQQMAAAEGGYWKSGYSRAWMAGQWPNTYPPCAGLFE